jgi:DNA polymerase-3 subunit epsilon
MAVALDSLRVCLLDCQSTGANPRSGHLLELAWAFATASGGDLAEDQVCSKLVSIPEDAAIPGRISAITGITEELLIDAPDPADVWAELEAAIADGSDEQPCWAVAHFARFEGPFLVDLHQRFGSGAFPLRLVCTRDLARRVVPELPRFGLRAIAGHLGHPLGEHRRSAGHVRATARIWREMCARLADQGVVDTDGLLQILAEPPPRRAEVVPVFPLSVERRKELPDRPGVYRFVDPSGRVLYVGKATSLRQRVATYFQPRGYRLATTLEMLTQAFEVRVTETATRVEAALLEVDEIKRLDPPYNTALRDRGNHRHSAAELLDALVSVAESPMWLVGNENVPPGIGLTYPEPPELETLRVGVGLFREVLLDGSDVTPERLAALGAVLWWEREEQERDEKAEAEPDEHDEQEDGEAPFAWTPERVARSLARGARLAAHLQRREIWQRLIGSSTITWRSREDKERDNMLTIEQGAVPDQLRVLTTELRRLVTDGRLVEIRLAPDVSVKPDRARALLEWI